MVLRSRSLKAVLCYMRGWFTGSERPAIVCSAIWLISNCNGSHQYDDRLNGDLYLYNLLCMSASVMQVEITQLEGKIYSWVQLTTMNKLYY